MRSQRSMGSNGFGMYPSPHLRNSMMSASCDFALRKIMGGCAMFAFLSSFETLSPLSFGIISSRRMRSNVCVEAFWRAISPFSAWTTSCCPIVSSARRAMVVMFGSSSAKRIFKSHPTFFSVRTRSTFSRRICGENGLTM